MKIKTPDLIESKPVPPQELCNPGIHPTQATSAKQEKHVSSASRA